MLNTLANHGLLPRHGRDINVNQTVYALNEALNLTPEFGAFLFTAGRLANPKPNATTFNLNHLDRHDLFEHDGSLRYGNSINTSPRHDISHCRFELTTFIS